MSISIYDQSIAPMLRMLKNLDAIVTKAENYAADGNIEPEALLKARLFPDMRDFIFQIRVTTDIAKGCAARLSGRELPSWEDNEETFADVHTRIGKAVDFLSLVKAEEFDASEKMELQLELGPYTVDFTGQSYLVGFVLPNFYFHIATAYNLLRHNGLAIGKMDFLGELSPDT